MDLGVLDPILLRIDLLLLIFLRMLGLFVTTPILSNRTVPIQLRVAISFGAAIIVYPLFNGEPSPAPDLLAMIPLAVRELMVGLVIGFVVTLTFSAVQLAGQLLDLNMGLAMMNVLDPTSNAQIPLMGNLLNIIATLVFLAINGHHLLITAIMDSYAIIPLGTAVITNQVTEALMIMASQMFVIGVKIAAPMVSALFLTIVALGILNRAVPQVNVFIIGMPLQFAVGTFMLLLVMPLYLTYLQVIFRTLFQEIQYVLQLMKG